MRGARIEGSAAPPRRAGFLGALRASLPDLAARLGPLAAPALALALGLLLTPILSLLDRAASALALALLAGSPALWGGLGARAAPILVEELAKLSLVAGFALLVRPRARGLSLALVALVVFAACENLLYFVAFPGSDLLGRLLWSSPIHLVTGLAYAAALGPAPSPGSRRLRPLLLALLFSLAWHGLANLLASGSPGPLLVGAVGLANGIALVTLARRFFARALLGGMHR